MNDALRVLLVTDGRGSVARIEAIVRCAVAGGVRAVQLREPTLAASELAGLCERVAELLRPQSGVLLVNDRLDLAAAGCAQGAHVGYRSLPPHLARRALPRPALLSAAAHDPQQLARARAADCDFALLSPVWPTPSKPGTEPLGPLRAGVWTAAAGLPVLWLGGVTSARARSIASLPPGHRPVGVAALGWICSAADPQAAAAELVAACRW